MLLGTRKLLSRIRATVPASGHAAHKAAAVLVASQLAAAGTAFLVNVLAARAMDPNARGELALALQISYILTVCALMGLERPYVATQSGSFYEVHAKFSALIGPGILIVAPMAIPAILLSPFGNQWIGAGMALVTGYIALNALSRALRVAYITSRDWQKFAMTTIATQILIVVGALYLSIEGNQSPSAWMATYTVSGIVPVVLLLIARIRLPKNLRMTKREASPLRKHGFKLLPSTFGNTAMLRSDRLLLPFLSSSSALGLYVTVATVMEMASWPIQQWVDASLRRWTEMTDALESYKRRLFLISIVWICGISVILGLVSLLVIEFVLPSSYASAKHVIIPLALASVIYGWTRIQQGLLVAYGATARVSLVEGFGMIISLLAYVALIPTLGIVGAAYGSIIGYFGCAVAGALMLHSRGNRVSAVNASGPEM